MKYLRLLCSCLIAWWPMQAVHELGHVLGCFLSGAKIERVILWPWTISQTIRTHSRAPLIDTWMGPVLGAAAPAILYLVFKHARFPGRAFLGFFSGFCLITNGLYVGLGWLDLVGDAGDLLHHGAPRHTLILFGAVCVTCGLSIWHAELFRVDPATPKNSR